MYISFRLVFTATKGPTFPAGQSKSNLPNKTQHLRMNHTGLIPEMIPGYGSSMFDVKRAIYTYIYISPPPEI